MDPRPIYEPSYSASWALVIGIDAYRHAPPLAHACNDANAMAKVLAERFQFPKENIKLLTDQAASRSRIVETFLKFANLNIGSNDRIVVFFAGHGHTVPGRRGETGFLVPVDGKIDDLSTLIRWDELTRNAELIPAKHMLFVMDACYGGLALSRKSLPPGSMRFVKDMLQRYSRQVLTAGKADEVVADAGGPRAGHSIFTAHVLDALEGRASTAEGIISANGLMAYVYEKVSNDPNSRQTPHYGFIDGDGDLIFDTSLIEQLRKEEKKDTDLLVKLSPFPAPALPSGESVAESLKELIGEPRQQIRLDDFISAHLRRGLDALSLERFPVQGVPVNAEQFSKRVRQYEDIVADLQTIVILLSRWADESQLPLLEKMFARLAEAEKGETGLSVWIHLAWYPTLLLIYAAGIAALSARRYGTLNTILTTRVGTDGSVSGGADTQLVIRTILSIEQIKDVFKGLPGYEQKYVPTSEYLFKLLQPHLEDLLFLGRSYESLFDRFEVLLALVFADIEEPRREGRIWGPPGRFAWKQRRGYGQSPFDELLQEAQQQGEEWEPLRAGLFEGSSERFMKIANGYKEFLNRLPWW